MIADVPVGYIAAPGVGQLADRVAVAIGLLDGLFAVFHSQQAVLLDLVVVELGQQQPGLSRVFRLFGKGAEQLFQLPLLGFVEQAMVVDAVLDAFHLLFRGHGEQLVYGDAEVYGDLRQQLHVRHTGAAFPLADSLRRHVQCGGKSFLRDAPFIPQTADFFSHFHDGVPLSVVVLS